MNERLKLHDYITQSQKIIDKRLDFLLQEKSPKIIYDAMRYSVFAGGKRLRPILCMLCYQSLSQNPEPENILDIACAIELIHTYSLIHDDLPAMDNDTLRRGKPTNHVVFGEAIAILAGDGLLNLAMEISLDWICKNQYKKEFIEAARYFFKCSGVEGMIGGQVIDIVNSGGEINNENLIKEMHIKKTSRLIQASCVCGAIVAKSLPDTIQEIEEFGENLGLAFQIRDDVLDFIGDEKKLGKSTLKDRNSKKNTFVTFYGLDKAQEYVELYSKRAIEIIQKYDKTGLLVELTRYLVNREK